MPYPRAVGRVFPILSMLPEHTPGPNDKLESVRMASPTVLSRWQPFQPGEAPLRPTRSRRVSSLTFPNPYHLRVFFPTSERFSHLLLEHFRPCVGLSTTRLYLPVVPANPLVWFTLAWMHSFHERVQPGLASLQRREIQLSNYAFGTTKGGFLAVGVMAIAQASLAF